MVPGSHDSGHIRTPPASSPSRTSPGTSARCSGSQKTTSAAACGAERLEPARQRVAGAERVRHRTGAACDSCTRGRRRPDPGPIALEHGRGTSDVPEDRDQDVHGAARPLDVAVEGAPESLGFVSGHERVDEDDAVARLAVHAADVLLPFLVVCGPAPETRRELEHDHGATVPRTVEGSLCVSSGRERKRKKRRMGI